MDKQISPSSNEVSESGNQSSLRKFSLKYSKRISYTILLIILVLCIVLGTVLATTVIIQKVPGVSTPYRPQPGTPTPYSGMDGSSIAKVPYRGPNVPAGSINALALEKWVFGYVNAERAGRGLEPMMLNSDLSNISRNYSLWMAKENNISHYLGGFIFTSRWEKHEYNCREGSEILLVREFRKYGEYSQQGRVNEQKLGHDIVKQWMFSPSHRNAIINEQNQETGIGIYVEYSNKTEEYTIWATQHFCARGGQGSRFDRRYDGWDEAFVAPRVTHVDTEDYRQYDPSRFDETVTPTPAG